MNPGIDIIIPTFGRPAMLAGLISCLLDQLKGSDSITVVWQGNSAPQLPHSRSVHLVHSSPANLPSARNAGLRAGQNAIVLFLDDDVEPAPGLLQAHRDCFNDHGLGAVAGYIEDTIFDPSATVPSFFDPRTGACIQNFSLPVAGETISVMGANMSFRRVALEKINGFDPRFTRNALFEEIDCAFRLRAAGYRIYFCPQARVKHLRANCGGCRSDSTMKYLYHQFANTSYFGCKYAPLQFRNSWIVYWWYRLEFLTRTDSSRMVRHNLAGVMAALAGAITGVLRYAFAVLFRNRYVQTRTFRNTLAAPMLQAGDPS